ncbi:MAG: hypothetical protein COT43_08400 [Candidatus Marinimicrobia bacterium CG08_land_8_20_14_0_20_45_22]|nr:MAG: hypothetical protein COT43_08400 [Candidatus Marinimicrobia bacterium CG08_land_8_20_14_0_20_45_22]
MPYCPKCKYEFVEGLTVCPDCGEPLVDQLPEENITPVKWVLLTTLSSPVIAEMVRGALNNQNIPATISSNILTSGLLAQSTGTAGAYAKIFVPEEHLKSAKLILSGMADAQ